MALLQGLQYAGYIEVKWKKIQADVVSVFDADGDGEFTVRDLTHGFRSIVRILAFQGPTAGGFVLGMYAGFGSG